LKELLALRRLRCSAEAFKGEVRVLRRIIKCAASDGSEALLKNTMKISIITAVFNGASGIVRTLDSVAEQDHRSIEHIVVDGASTDGTMGLVRLRGAGVARCISEPDGGVYDAFNKGLRLATGDAIGFLNCGDAYVSSNIVSRIAEGLSAPGVEAIFGDVLVEDRFNRNRIIRRYSSSAFTPARMAYGLMPAHPTLFLCRNVYEQIGEYNPRFRIAGDFELCLRVFARRKTNYRYVPGAMVLMPNGGLSNRGWRSKLEITREMRLACLLDGVRTNTFKLCLRFPLKMLELL
jgi:glycosyltransferase involved in cell wall biosynthesis